MHIFFKSRQKHNLYYILDSEKEQNRDELKVLEEILLAKHILYSELSHEKYILIKQNTVSPFWDKLKSVLQHSRLDKIYQIEPFRAKFKHTNYDRLTEDIFSKDFLLKYFDKKLKNNFENIIKAREIPKINEEFSLALNKQEIKYLKKIKKKLSLTELFTFAQINSEHCRHKKFNKTLLLSKKKFKYEKKTSLFKLIEETSLSTPKEIVLAYKDNACILDRESKTYLERINKKYKLKNIKKYLSLKVETHNHPTAILPYEGAATGVGGEIRDEQATALGGDTKAGVCGYFTAKINFKSKIKNQIKQNFNTNEISSPLKIILDAPIGASDYSNEFGRPLVFGIFRTLENKNYSFHKPIMLAGGIGETKYTQKKLIQKNDLIILLGSPSLKLGIAGGSSSSINLNNKNNNLNSIQRSNPEVERKTQEFINTATQKDIIKSIHDLGAGGLSVALAEAVEKNGAEVYLRNIPIYDNSMSPYEIWINESQERQLIIIQANKFNELIEIANRENLLISYIGKISDDKKLNLKDAYKNETNILMDINAFLPKLETRYLHINTEKRNNKKTESNDKNTTTLYNTKKTKKLIKNTIIKTLKTPVVADKNFLIHIADKTISGKVYKDQLAGINQIPIRDYSIILDSFYDKTAQIISMAEKSFMAIKSPSLASKHAIAEIITNMSGAYIKDLSDIKLSANWMASTENDEEMKELYFAVKELSDGAKALGIAIPVGKDSLSMKTKYHGKIYKAPISLVLTAVSKAYDIEKSIDPDLKNKNSLLYTIKLKTINKKDDFEYRALKDFFYFIQTLLKNNMIDAYHDISDGGMISCVLEMAFASSIGIKLNLKTNNIMNKLFSEFIGAVVEINKENLNAFLREIEKVKNKNILLNIEQIGSTSSKKQLSLYNNNQKVYKTPLLRLHKTWSQFSYKIKSLRDNGQTSREEYKNIESFYKKENIKLHIPFDTDFTIPLLAKNLKKRKLAILREEGTNGHKSMANAFYTAGFEVFEINLNDISKAENSNKALDKFDMLVFAGGFSFGDIVQAGQGVSQIILQNKILKEAFKKFFYNQKKLVLGVCNGAQILSKLKNIIPDAEHFTEFKQNKSESFESRHAFVKIQNSKSILLKDMEGAILAVPIAHKEGRISIKKQKAKALIKKGLIPFVYIETNNKQEIKYAKSYPNNPNGSTLGITSFTNMDGRITAMMPHPERTIFAHQNSIYKAPYPNFNPWFKLFLNAQNWFLKTKL